MKPRILAATAQPGYPVLRSLFEEQAEMSYVFTLGEALERLRAERFDLLICTIHFDESRMFDLERQARTIAPRVPIVCVRLLHSILAPATLDSVGVTVRAYGGEFIDRQALHRELGPDAGDRRFVSSVLARAAPPGANP